MVGKQHGLGRLDVRGAGQDGVPLAFREIDQRLLERDDRGVEAPDRAARPEPQVRGDLVVPGPAGVQPAAQGPDALREHHLQVHVDVLERRIPHDRARDHVVP